ncbi:PHD-type domain-containing protein [Mycena kentingensis (nom. inval.)]|nr:PHD-type domain-containing protein [Mycena kentingensis (nom. inval.)]
MSRRLDISSLLCPDDDPPVQPDRIIPETVILAPHLAVRKHGPSHPRPPLPPEAQSLDALAQAAALHRSDPFSQPYPMPPPVRYDQPRRFWDSDEQSRPFTSPSPHQPVEPPHKKRRPSDVAMPSIRLPVFHRPPVVDPTPFGYRGPMTDDRFGPQDTNPHLLPASGRPSEPIQAHTVIHLTERAHDDYLVEDRKPKKSHRSPDNPRPASHQRRPTQPPKPKEEDAHDWLLGQLPEQPSKRTPALPSPDPVKPVVVTTPEQALPPPTNGKPDDKMDVDIDDELLGLVDSGSARQAKAPSRHVSPASTMPPPSDRGSMPPPASTVVAKKKKETVKPKPKAPAKPRAKPAPKPRPKPSDKGKPTAIQRKSGSAAASRSRSNSAMPGSVGPDGSEKPEEEEEELMPVAEDDKLYCICKTTYDEDRFMIACDKCDEWYHTQCVDMPDLVVDLVDQFFCPPCIAKNPDLSLTTTYKPRCRNGLEHPEPDSPNACHKPAKGALSKYCSDECGLNTLKLRIERFAQEGGKKENLWESVKHAQKREAVVVVHAGDDCGKENGPKPAIGRVEREEASLNAVLEEVVEQRESLRQGMDIIIWRERLLDLASERAEQIGQCGWDSRLLFGEEDWAECGDEVLENYDREGEEWWCLENESCERHSGWKQLRASEVAKEKENKEEALRRLTTRERELRKRIEDIVEPFNRSCRLPASLKSSKMLNGNKKGKKRKNPS